MNRQTDMYCKPGDFKILLPPPLLSFLCYGGEEEGGWGGGESLHTSGFEILVSAENQLMMSKMECLHSTP